MIIIISSSSSSNHIITFTISYYREEHRVGGRGDRHAALPGAPTRENNKQTKETRNIHSNKLNHRNNNATTKQPMNVISLCFNRTTSKQQLLR